MFIRVVDDYPTLSRLAAEILARQIEAFPNSVLGLASGSTPVGLYRELARRQRDGLSFSRVTTFNLDEYLGLPRGHAQRFASCMQRELFSHLDIDPEGVHFPDVDDVDGVALDGACARYEERIKQAGGLDVQILGVGANGHIAFNEPGSAWTSRTRIVELTERTRRDNAAAFQGDEVPARAITMGIGTILEARQVILLASGKRKAEAVRRLIDGPESIAWPVTALRSHPNVLVLFDRAAARHE